MSEKSGEYKVRIDKIAAVMLDKLNENAYKGTAYDWDKCDPWYLLAKLQEEAGELADAVLRCGDVTSIRREAADVANIAMMVADAYKWQNSIGGDEHE